MQLKKYQKNERNQLNSFRQSVKVVEVLQVSPNESQRKSNTSTHLSQRSNSARKILVPRSHKLSSFFNQSIREHSGRKIMISAYPSQTLTSHFVHQKQTNVGEKIQLLKYNVNEDYFDDENKPQTLRNNIAKELNMHKKRQNQQRYQKIRQHPISFCTISGQNCKQDKKGINSKKQIGKSKRMKSPRTLVYPVAEIMQKSRGHGKIYSANSLEYTFGLK